MAERETVRFKSFFHLTAVINLPLFFPLLESRILLLKQMGMQKSFSLSSAFHHYRSFKVLMEVIRSLRYMFLCSTALIFYLFIYFLSFSMYTCTKWASLIFVPYLADFPESCTKAQHLFQVSFPLISATVVHLDRLLLSLKVLKTKMYPV